MTSRNIDPIKQISGEIKIPGDKSISHRAVILGTLAEGKSRVTNFLTAQDCMHTLRACQKLGAKIKLNKNELEIVGRGKSSLLKPKTTIDCGNSGTGVRLLTGMLAGQPFESVITGDEQVRRRPMRRILEPLKAMGARIESQTGMLCPLRIHGGKLKAIDYNSPVASAQVKSCILLAGLFAEGKTKVVLPAISRDHTERMLEYFGAEVTAGGVAASMSEYWSDSNGEWVSVSPQPRLKGQEVVVPSDISSAAFFIVAAALSPGAELHLPNVGVNPTRTGILEILEKMGAEIDLNNQRIQAGEPVADLVVKGKGRLTATSIRGANLIPRLIDELPILAVAAAAAEGETVIEDAAELRVKETDRITVLSRELNKIGVDIIARSDGMVIQGNEIRGGKADSHGDHRLAMSLAVAGLVSEQGVVIENSECVNTSFPDFWELLRAASK